MDRHGRLLRAHLLGRHEDADRAVFDAAAESAVRIVPAWRGVEMVVCKAGAVRTIGASDPWTRRAAGRRGPDELVAADFVTGRVRRAVDPAAGPWMQTLAEHGVRTVETVPLFGDADVPVHAVAYVGGDTAVTVVGVDPEGVALDLVQNRLSAWALQSEVTQVRAALESNRRIGVAMGVIVAQFRITEAEAFDLLREASQKRNVKLRDIADHVVLTGSLDFER